MRIDDLDVPSFTFGLFKASKVDAASPLNERRTVPADPIDALQQIIRQCD